MQTGRISQVYRPHSIKISYIDKKGDQFIHDSNESWVKSHESMSHESMSQWVRGVFFYFFSFHFFLYICFIFSTIWLILWQILTVNLNLFRTWRLYRYDYIFEICRIHSTICLLFSTISWCLFLEVKYLTTEDHLPPMQGMRIIIAFIFALQSCMVGNEIGLIHSFSILMCNTRRLSLQLVKDKCNKMYRVFYSCNNSSVWWWRNFSV